MSLASATNVSTATNAVQTPTRCTMCSTELATDHVHMGQPFITAWQLVQTIVLTAVRTPNLLGDLLINELDQVPYCATCREELSVKRQSEQLKFAFGLLLIAALVIGLPTYLIYFA
jgi:hypothetical protein